MMSVRMFWPSPLCISGPKRRTSVPRFAFSTSTISAGRPCGPDFGTISITYVPDRRCIELKSLKLYLWSFRNDGIFYERAVNRILDDLVKAARPRRMVVVGDFNLRGGIKSVITATYDRAKRPRS